MHIQYIHQGKRSTAICHFAGGNLIAFSHPDGTGLRLLAIPSLTPANPFSPVCQLQQQLQFSESVSQNRILVEKQAKIILLLSGKSLMFSLSGSVNNLSLIT
ncbi:hypothetical protein [Klebsiella quasipneumoniae]|jgi:hypothetical protein|uniref:hypothetical protein n=1 Tax=Klebsiella quasipneumoniae TaxID=1463165 RepID=UPI0013043563|nr:hypothetical protein [Klebsiella quasipneumoniae]KAE9754417.1 hypothetical protein GP728_22135 [Enterobacteriaceae bacterium TzEc084]MVY07809.1 hypothetical protein [Enterobacteriaceae bacterium 8376wH8]MBF7751346.1 hypothetical protein [Klebsiella quasipneumoniae]MBF7777446.1 hypothetical protein [Klebsiella quasipneumoniae]UDC73278.1 hypothetical protein LGM22_12290 [Klebsiella quasipneumoniae subsp. quasipneumoniae]